MPQSLTTISPRRPRTTKNAYRDLSILKKVEIENLSHDEVAGLFRIDRTRVTQIVSRVRRELAQAEPTDPQIKDHRAQQRLQMELEQFRLQHALTAADKAMRRTYGLIVTTREGKHEKYGHTEKWHEETSRTNPPDVKPITTYLRITRDLANLRDRRAANVPLLPAPANPHTAVPGAADQFFAHIQAALEDWCRRARAADTASEPSSTRLEFLPTLEQFRAQLLDWLHHHAQPAALPTPHTAPLKAHIAAPKPHLDLTSPELADVSPTPNPSTS